MSQLNNLALRKNRVRAKVGGTAERPRLSVFISNRNVSAQLIDDTEGKTLASASSLNTKEGSLSEKAANVGAEIAEKAQKAGIKKAVLDRNGHQYAGRLSALATAAREKGLEF